MNSPKDAFCSYCGTVHTDEFYPKTCRGCGQTTWSNPLPVSVVLIPVFLPGVHDPKVLLVKRRFAPVDGIALVGGIAETGESPVEAAAREVREETGVKIEPEHLHLLGLDANPAKTFYLSFWQHRSIHYDPRVDFKPNPEVKELILGDRRSELCFPLHQKYLNAFYS